MGLSGHFFQVLNVSFSLFVAMFDLVHHAEAIDDLC